MRLFYISSPRAPSPIGAVVIWASISTWGSIGVSQNRCSTALHPFLEVGVRLGVYGVCLDPTSCFEYDAFHLQVHVSWVRKKVVVMTMESSRSHRVARPACVCKYQLSTQVDRTSNTASS